MSLSPTIDAPSSIPALPGPLGLVVIVALSFGVGYWTGALPEPVNQPDAAAQLGEDWHGNVRRSHQ